MGMFVWEEKKLCNLHLFIGSVAIIDFEMLSTQSGVWKLMSSIGSSAAALSERQTHFVHTNGKNYVFEIEYVAENINYFVEQKKITWYTFHIKKRLYGKIIPKMKRTPTPIHTHVWISELVYSVHRSNSYHYLLFNNFFGDFIGFVKFFNFFYHVSTFLLPEIRKSKTYNDGSSLKKEEFNPQKN
jgi:hypothetical protein